jgi:hypothetical protein
LLFIAACSSSAHYNLSLSLRQYFADCFHPALPRQSALPADKSLAQQPSCPAAAQPHNLAVEWPRRANASGLGEVPDEFVVDERSGCA